MADSDKYAVYDEQDTTKEPGTFSGTKFHDIMPATGGPGARLAARLCNFPTNHSALRMSHRRWLDDYVQPVLRSLEGPWVDFIGYASQLGPAGNNYFLSSERCRKVKDWVSNYSSRIHWNVQWPKGASESATIASNNDGWWRAVEISIYGFKPPTAMPSTMGGSRDFEIRYVVGGSVSPGDLMDSPLPVPGGHGYVFEITDKKNSEKAYFVHGQMTLPLLTVPVFPFVGGLGANSSLPGPPTPFHTSVPVELHDFEGTATVFQNPGVSSLGGNLTISIESDALARLGAVLRPSSVLTVNTSSGVLNAPSLGAVGLPGTLTMWGAPRPY
ncbi:MAG TPA: hypothetical protein VKR61_11480 [Bryobacteraceae bacterium]|nr:hypothetical protein [Bryobacteraceae bacterium]